MEWDVGIVQATSPATLHHDSGSLDLKEGGRTGARGGMAYQGPESWRGLSGTCAEGDRVRLTTLGGPDASSQPAPARAQAG